ncbi:MAG: hypothetical protein NVV63_12610 [Opitutus sp.]|nr:hypothetical protein [Opitutus sp.]
MAESLFPRFDHSQRLDVERLCPVRPIHREPRFRPIGRALSYLGWGVAWALMALFIFYVFAGFFNLIPTHESIPLHR